MTPDQAITALCKRLAHPSVPDGEVKTITECVVELARAANIMASTEVVKQYGAAALPGEDPMAGFDPIGGGH